MPVNELVRVLGIAQPQVSKHLRVLREVGAVDVREHGRQRLYRVNGEALKPMHDWVKAYERTTLMLLAEHSSKEHRDAHINSGMEDGMQDAFDLLEEVAVALR